MLFDLRLCPKAIATELTTIGSPADNFKIIWSFQLLVERQEVKEVDG